MSYTPARLIAALLIPLAVPAVAAGADLTVSTEAVPTGGMSLVDAPLLVDAGAATVVHQAAELLADDLGRVSGTRPQVYADVPRHWRRSPAAVVMIGTLGDGGPVDQLVTSGKVDASGVRGQWETFAWQLIAPQVGTQPTLVIVGSDRRGTAYGCTELSKAIGVSPWAWWADVPLEHHAQLAVTPGRRVDGPPGVKYRGIFINDEDWGLQPWAAQTFDPHGGHTEVGPKTYAKVFELMLRMRLNYLWPAMHPGSGEFGGIPGNAAMADKYAIVMGASHCEPMLRNNVYWDRKLGDWRYDTNGKNILNYWAESAKDRGQYEGVWTLGIRGIHDSQMQGPPGVPARVKMVEGIVADQRQLIDTTVTKTYGPPAECLVPYKEVLPLYDAGMTVPADVTLVWPDDNFGYIRHLPTAAERKRSGGNGDYYHVSYWGSPHSYLWVESTAPGLMWEELHKAWQNDVRRLWVVNVGDIKPAEVAIDFYSKLAWNPDAWRPDAQDVFLRKFFADTFAAAAAGPVFDLESLYYRVATRRKPEHFLWGGRSGGRTEWMDSLSAGTLAEVSEQYDALVAAEGRAAAAVPADRADSYFEMVGYAARALGLSGQMYVRLARADHGQDSAANRAAARNLYKQIEADADRYNERVAGGKWRHMMALKMEGLAWPTAVGGTVAATTRPTTWPDLATRPATVDAGAFTSATAADGASWQWVAGLGRSGHAMTALPAVPFKGTGPTVTYAFTLPAAADRAVIRLDLLPTMRVDPTGHLRVSVAVDGAAASEVAVPGGASGDENNGPRRDGVISNRVQITRQAAAMSAGRHTLTVTAVDPGVVLDAVELPAGATVVPPAGR